MQPPVDYPVQDSSENSLSSKEVSYAKLMDRHAQAKPISVEMIQSAQTLLEAAQELPDAAKPTDAIPRPHTPVLKRLLNTIR